MYQTLMWSCLYWVHLIHGEGLREETQQNHREMYIMDEPRKTMAVCVDDSRMTRHHHQGTYRENTQSHIY